MAIGEVSVEGMLRKLTMRQLLGWAAYFEILDEEQVVPETIKADYRAAMIQKTIADVFRGKGKPPNPIERFLLKFKKKEEQSPLTREEKIDQQVAIAKIIALSYNASLKKTTVH